jgi:hypothetical protein
MTTALFPVIALTIACSSAPAPAPPTGESRPAPAAEEPAPAAPEASTVPPARGPVSIPIEPALSSFTGQGTQRGIGLWSAFYPLGWSDDGRFAWAVERWVNDMAIEYGATWSVLHVGSELEREVVGFGAEDFPEGARLAWAWERQRVRVEDLLAEGRILAGGTELTPLPAETMVGLLEARWELGEMRGHQRPATLLIRLGGGQESAVFETELSDLAGAPAAPSLVLSPSGQHAALVIPTVRGEPVEALVDVEYVVRGLQLGPT